MIRAFSLWMFWARRGVCRIRGGEWNQQEFYGGNEEDRAKGMTRAFSLWMFFGLAGGLQDSRG